MRHLIFFDTETTGKDPHTARICEIAHILVKIEDGKMEKLSEGSVLILPEDLDQFPPSDAVRIHGITGDEMLEKGVPLSEALVDFDKLCDFSIERGYNSLLVAHNQTYDNTVILFEHRRCGLPSRMGLLTPFCTMLSMTERCRLPGRYGKYKWPSLREAWEFCFDKDWSLLSEEGQAHRALFDTRRCLDIYLHGLGEGWWNCD